MEKEHYHPRLLTMWWQRLAAFATGLLGWSRTVDAVNHSQFKTCHQSGFCSRQRHYAEDPSHKWIVPLTSIRVGEKVVKWAIERDDGRVKLESSVHIYQGGIVRIRIDEPSRSLPRYHTVPNDIVLDKNLYPLQLDHETVVEEGILRIYAKVRGESSAMAQIKLHDFSISIQGHDGKPILGFGQQGFFNVESTGEAEEEVFQRWTDSQPQGRQSLGADVSLYGVTHLMGLPEHATALNLKATKSGITFPKDDPDNETLSSSTYTEPYRLYNLDVFEYELDSPMALYGSIPMMIGVEAGNRNSAVGLFWNNPSEGWVDVYDGAAVSGGRMTHFMSESGIIDLMCFAGPLVTDVISQYYQVTGRPFMPPLFSLGYHQCRWNYMSQEDLLQVNANLDLHQIPADVLWLDIEHTDRKCYFTWNKAAFPNPLQMQSEMIGRELVLIVDPHLKKDMAYPLYAQITENTELAVMNKGNQGIFEGDCWPGPSVWPDFIDPLTRIWWRKQFLLSNPTVFMTLMLLGD